MMIVGVTGGIGSGKSVVCEIFSHLGIPVYDADTAAKQLYEKYPVLAEKVRSKISPEAVDKNGKVNRKKLAEIVFNNPAKLELLNSFVHPLVRKDFDDWKQLHRGYPYVLKEAAILFESGSSEECDRIITVVSPVELRMTRVRERDRKSRAEIEAIMDKQSGDDEKTSRSDFVIVNDEKEMLIPQVLRIHDALMKLNPVVMPAQ
jgi:dephospho-CoA kinase